MRRSTDRILTTHAGSLPRPKELREAWSRPSNNPQQEAELQHLLQKSVVNIVAEQKEVGVDIPNDGEFGKPMRAASDLAAWGRRRRARSRGGRRAHAHRWYAVGTA
jgi:5-methyltetrahydropteroyltriglutamate--homocysteine methyltransferase